MTSITLSFSDEELASFQAEAQAQGLTLENWFRKVAKKEAPSTSLAHLQKTDPEVWIRHLEAFVARLPKTPVLPDEAMSRQSIYSDRS